MEERTHDPKRGWDDTAAPTFAAAAEEWLCSVKPRLKASSFAKYSNLLRSHLHPPFQERKVTELCRSDVTLLTHTLLSSGGAAGRGLSPKTVSGILSVLKNVLRFAAEEKSLAVADIRNVTVKQAQRPIKVFSNGEQQRLNRYLCDHLDPCHLGILLCLYTGLRLGEVCALKWEDISFSDRELYIHRSIQRIQQFGENGRRTQVIISEPKSSCSIRVIPLPKEVLRLLAACRSSDGAFLLTGCSRYMEPRTMQNRFKSVLRQCEIADTNFHTLRHTFATRCVELGFDIKSLSEILGHASVNITMNRYVHPSMEWKRQNMDLLSRLL